MKASVLFFILLLTTSVLAIGAAPSSFNFPGMLRGGYSEQTVTVSNPSSSDVTIIVSGDGEISQWIHAEPNEFILSPGSSAPVTIIVEPPIDIANGEYKNDLLVLGKPTNAGDGQVAIVGGVSLAVTAEITDNEETSFEVRRVTIPATEECRPIEVRVSVANTGNVRVIGDFTFTLKTGEKVLKSIDYITETLLPTREHRFSVELPYEIEQYDCVPVGDYTIDVVGSLSGQEQYSASHPFTIFERGSLSILGELTNIVIPENVEAGQLIKIEADFKNTGELTYRAQLVTELYSGSAIADTVKGDVVEVFSGNTKTLEVLYRPTLPGDYTLKLYAQDSISGAKTIEVEYPFKVILPTIYLIAGLIILIIIILVIILKLRKKDTQVSQNT
jgi:hypothetical protein